MRIGILKADSVLPNLAPRFGEYTDMFPALLARADPELTFAPFDVEHGEFPEDPGLCDGYLITGSRYSVYDALPWIPPLEEFIRTLVERRTKLVGVCFGHQLVARALGGRTEPAARGWTVGVQRSTIETPFPWADEPRGDVRLIHSHKDQVTLLPPGAQPVGGNEVCPMALYHIDDHVMSLQAHPEFTTQYARALWETRREALGEEVYRDAVSSLDAETDASTFARWMVSFFRTP